MKIRKIIISIIVTLVSIASIVGVVLIFNNSNKSVEKNKYTITVVENNNVFETFDLDKDSNVYLYLTTKYKNTKLGYSFAYKTEDNSELDKNYLIDKDIKITRFEQPIVYTINYELNGGSLSTNISNRSTYTIETETFTLYNPSKMYYDFTGWYVGEDETLQTSYSVTKGTTGNLTFTANYKLTEYPVQIWFNNGKVGEGTYKFGSEQDDIDNIIENMTQLIPAGYEIEWDNFSSSDSNAYNKQKIYKIYGELVKEEYNITYNLDGGVQENAITKYDVETDNYLVPAPAKEYYNFVGWKVNDDEEVVSSYTINAGSTGNLKFEAVFEAVKYSVTFKNGEEIVATQYYTVEDRTHVVSPELPVLVGYENLSWETYDISTGVGDKVVNLNKTAIQYEVKFMNGETQVGETQYYTIENRSTVEIVVPSTEGYTKAGYHKVAWEEFNLSNKNENITVQLKGLSPNIVLDLGNNNIITTWYNTDDELLYYYNTDSEIEPESLNIFISFLFDSLSFDSYTYNNVSHTNLSKQEFVDDLTELYTKTIKTPGTIHLD